MKGYAQNRPRKVPNKQKVSKTGRLGTGQCMHAFKVEVFLLTLSCHMRGRLEASLRWS